MFFSKPNWSVKVVIWICKNYYMDSSNCKSLPSLVLLFLLHSSSFTDQIFSSSKIFFFSSEDYIFSFVKFSLLVLFLLHTSFPPQTKYVPSPNIFLLFPSAFFFSSKDQISSSITIFVLLSSVDRILLFPRWFPPFPTPSLSFFSIVNPPQQRSDHQ